MTKERDKISYGSKALSEYMNKCLLAQSSIVNSCIKKDLLKARSKEITAAIGTTLNTANAIAVLGSISDAYYNECVMLARGFFERIVNICYLLVCDDEVFESYKLHAKQKAFRKLEQEFSAGDEKISLRFEGKDSIEIDGDLEKGLKEFSTKKGKEKKGWPGIPIQERLRIIGKRSNIKIGLFLWYQLSYYTDASEALHGSFYGCTYHIGTYTPNIDISDKEDVKKNLQDNIALLLLSTGNLLNQLLRLISNNSSISDFLSLSNEISRDTTKVLKTTLKQAGN